MKLSGETKVPFSVLRESAKPEVVNAIEKLIENSPDRELCRINALALRGVANQVEIFEIP